LSKLDIWQNIIVATAKSRFFLFHTDGHRPFCRSNLNF